MTKHSRCIHKEWHSQYWRLSHIFSLCHQQLCTSVHWPFCHRCLEGSEFSTIWSVKTKGKRNDEKWEWISELRHSSLHLTGYIYLAIHIPRVVHLTLVFIFSIHQVDICARGRISGLTSTIYSRKRLRCICNRKQPHGYTMKTYFYTIYNPNSSYHLMGKISNSWYCNLALEHYNSKPENYMIYILEYLIGEGETLGSPEWMELASDGSHSSLVICVQLLA